MSATDPQRRALVLFDELVELSAEIRVERMRQLQREDPALHEAVQALLVADAQTAGVLECDVGAVFADGDAADALLGHVIGPWRVTGVIGRGGMGAVYRGERIAGEFQQQAAIKLIRFGLDQPEMRKRFLRERQLLARLEHPNIARLLDGGLTDAGAPYFAMELVDGEPIDRWADAHRLDLRARIRLFLQICSAVQSAHQALAVHRDLKPGNILVTADGQAKLLDFGIAKLLEDEGGDTRTRYAALTPEYAAPEQLHGEPVTTATDVYALGVVLYGLLTGSHPHGDASGNSLRQRLANIDREPEPITRAAARADEAQAQARGLSPRALADALRGDLAAIVHRCLETSPGLRYRSVDALASDLKAWLNGLPVGARAGQRGYRLRKFIARNRIAVASTVLVIVALAAGMGVAMWQARIARAHAARADAEAARAEREAEQVRTQVARVRKVKEFMVSVFLQADPLRREGAAPPSVAEALDLALERARSGLADDPVLQADVFDDFGEIRAGQGRMDDAEALFRQAVAVAEKEYGPNHPVLAESLVNLGVIQGFRGNALAGEPYLTRAVAILDKDDSGEQATLASALSGLAAVRQQQGRLHEAGDMVRRALAINRKILGQDALEIAVQLTNVANMDANDGRYAQAEGELREAMRIVTKHQGEDSPHLWPNLAILTNVLYALGRHDEEAQAARRALAVADKTYPDDHRWRAASLLSVGTIEARMGELAAARAHMEQSVQMYERLKSPLMVRALRGLALLELQQGRKAEARGFFDRAWATCDAGGQAEEQQCLVVRANRANLMAKSGEAQAALTEADAAFAGLVRVAPEGASKDRAQALQAKASALAALGRHDAALAAQDQAIALLRADLGDGHMETREAVAARAGLRAARS